MTPLSNQVAMYASEVGGEREGEEPRDRDTQRKRQTDRQTETGRQQQQKTGLLSSLLLQI